MSWTVAGLSLIAGLVSALIPFVNAEALAAGASRANKDLLPVVVVALAAGQTIGKLALFELSGRGASRLAGRTHSRPAPTRWASKLASRSVSGIQVASSKLPVVAVSAFTGIPPLAAVAVAAGTTDTHRSGFAAACFVGRTLRFALIAYGLAFMFVH
jgi:membrane protein YqaA with SNARE-associated domain